MGENPASLVLIIRDQMCFGGYRVPMVREGDEVGGYTLLEQIGSGGMGTVYRAEDPEGNEVALKLLHPQHNADPQARARLKREVDSLLRVRSPMVAAVLDAETDLDEAFIVTELIDGIPLNESVEQQGVFSGRELLEFTDDLHRALTAVHKAGVVHRDLKPGNVLVTDHGPVLIDFGIAHLDDATRMTSSGLVMGTPGYLAPEVLTGSDIDEDSDWWSCAAVLAFAATGRPVFGKGPLEAVLGRVQEGRMDLKGLSPRVAAVFEEALAVDPEERIDHVTFRDELELAIDQGDEPLTDAQDLQATELMEEDVPQQGRYWTPTQVDEYPDDAIPPVRKSWGVFIALSAAWIGFFSYAPLIAAIVLVVGVFIAHCWSRIGRGIDVHRYRSGSIGPTRVMGLWANSILKSIPSMLASAGIALVCAFLVTLIAVRALSASEYALPIALLLGGLGGVIAIWVGMNRDLSGDGFARWTRAAVPALNARFILIILFVLIAVGLGAAVLMGGLASLWWPLGSTPSFFVIS